MITTISLINIQPIVAAFRNLRCAVRSTMMKPAPETGNYSDTNNRLCL